MHATIQHVITPYTHIASSYCLHELISLLYEVRTVSTRQDTGRTKQRGFSEMAEEW
jgi:hypothetical protein